MNAPADLGPIPGLHLCSDCATQAGRIRLAASPAALRCIECQRQGQQPPLPERESK